MDSHLPSTSAASTASSPALDSAARRSCTKCSRRMSSYAHDKHTLCLHCRNGLCSVDNRCRECSSWSTDKMLEYLKHRKSLVAKGRKRSSVATPTSAARSVSPSATPVSVSASVASPPSTLPSLASEEGLKSFVHSVLASFLSQPASSLSLGINPSFSAPLAEVPDVSRSGLTGGSDGDNLMRGRQVTPSGVVPPPLEDVISSPNILLPVSLASGSVSSVGGVGALGPSNPSLGQFSVPIGRILTSHVLVVHQVLVMFMILFLVMYVMLLLLPLLLLTLRLLFPMFCLSSCFCSFFSCLFFSSSFFFCSYLFFPCCFCSSSSVHSSLCSISFLFFFGSFFSSSAVSSSFLPFRYSSLFACSSSFVFCSSSPFGSCSTSSWFFGSALPSSGSALFRCFCFSSFCLLCVLHSPLLGPFQGSPLSLLCLTLPFLLLRLLGILQTFRIGCWVSPRNIRR